MMTWSNHPAKFSETIIDTFAEILNDVPAGSRILDPFAGTGRVHWFENFETWGVEIEPEGAAMHPRTILGDATRLPFPDDTFDVILTSPVYGNRMSDHHNARDVSTRHTYRHTIGHELHERNAGRMHFRQECYKDLHQRVYSEMGRVTHRKAIIVLNVSDFIADGMVVDAADWHRATMETYADVDWTQTDQYAVPTPRNGNGANRELRVEHEMVYVFKRY